MDTYIHVLKRNAGIAKIYMMQIIVGEMDIRVRVEGQFVTEKGQNERQ